MKKSIKKITGILFALVMIFALLPATAFANDNITVIANGQTVVFADQGPVIVDGRTLVPVAGVLQALGFTTQWNSYTHQVTITRGDDVIVLTVGSNVFTINYVQHSLDVPPQIIGDRTMLPIAIVLRSVGYDVAWSILTRTVVITAANDTAHTTPYYTINDFLLGNRPVADYTFAVEFFYIDSSEIVSAHYLIYGSIWDTFVHWAHLNNVYDIQLIDYSLIMTSDIVTLPSGQMGTGSNRVLELELSSEFYDHINGDNGELLTDSLMRTLKYMWRPIAGRIQVNIIVSGDTVYSSFADF